MPFIHKKSFFSWLVLLTIITSSCAETESTVINLEPFSEEEVYESYIPRSLNTYPIDSVRVTLEMILGGWRRATSVFYKSLPAADAMYESVPVSGHIYFDSSTVYYLTYPCRLHCQTNFTLGDNYLTYENYQIFADSIGSFEGAGSDIHFVDSLGYLYVSGEYYIRDNVDYLSMEVLKENILNPSCLVGEWGLIHEEWYDYGTYDTLIYPWELPEILDIQTKQAQQCVAEQALYLDIEGRNHPFFIKRITEGGELVLEPDGWYETPENVRPLIIKYRAAN